MSTLLKNRLEDIANGDVDWAYTEEYQTVDHREEIMRTYPEQGIGVHIQGNMRTIFSLETGKTMYQTGG